MEVSLHDTTEVLATLSVATRTNGTDAGASIDCADADSVHFMLPVTSRTDGSHEVQFFHREKSSESWVRIPTADLDALTTTDLTDDSGNGRVTVSNADYDDKVIQLSYIGGKRHVKADIVTTAATTGADMGVLVQLAKLRFTGKNPMLTGWDS